MLLMEERLSTKKKLRQALSFLFSVLYLLVKEEISRNFFCHNPSGRSKKPPKKLLLVAFSERLRARLIEV